MNLKTIRYITAVLLVTIITVLNQASAVASVNPDSKAVIAMGKNAHQPLICINCHRARNINTNEGVISSNAFCYDCHRKPDVEKKVGKINVSLQVTPDIFNKNQPMHRFIACIQCHTDVARSPHKTKTGAKCLACHHYHSEGIAHSPHLRVSCQACHFKSKFVRLDPKDHIVKLASVNYTGIPISLASHTMANMKDKTTCKKCHFRKNPVGAPALVLPSKGAICILCHNAPLAMGSHIFGLAAFIFIVGIICMVAFWFKGSVKGEETSLHRKISLSSEAVWNTIFSKKIFVLIKIFIFDVIFQRRILKESVSRWAMHSLIFTSILLRFALALFTSLGFYFKPQSHLMIALINKNNWFTASVNDLLGLFILIGVIWAIIRRFIVKPEQVASEYQDTIALIIIGILVLLGFLLEGIRIIMTGIPHDMAVYSFVGYIISRALSAFTIDWTSVYPLMWYAHGTVAAVFVAYLPFGKMKHIFNAPLTYFIEEVDGVKK